MSQDLKPAQVDFVSNTNDMTFGRACVDDDKLKENLLNAKKMFHEQVGLCHDLMDMSGWSRKDPMAYLAECYRAAAMGIGYIDKALKEIGIAPMAPVEVKTQPIEVGRTP